MQKRLTVLSEVGKQFNYILQVALGFDGFGHVVAAAFELVAAGGVLDDLSLLHALHQPVVDA